MWDSFDIMLFNAIKGIIQKQFPFTNWYMDGEPIGWYMFLTMMAALVGQGIVVVLNSGNNKRGGKR